MKNKQIQFKDLLKDEINKDLFPYTYNNIDLIINSTSKPAYSFKGREVESIQNENMLMKGNGLRIPISKFIIK